VPQHRPVAKLCAVAPVSLCDRPMTEEAAISIKGLSKTYKGGKQALHDINLDVPRG